MVEKAVAVGIVIHAAAKMLNAIADDEIVDVQKKVVAGYLVEYFLRDGNARSLVFHYHSRTESLVVEHRVAAHALVADRQLYLVCHQRQGIAEMGNKIVDKMLAHILLRSQGNVFASENVENMLLASCGLYFYVVFW